METIDTFGPGATRAGIITYGNSATSLVRFDDFNDKNSLIEYIGNIKYESNQERNIAAGIKRMVDDFGTHSHEDTDTIGVVVTTGESTIYSEDAVPRAEDARTMGIVIYVIGITNNVNEETVKRMSSAPQELDRNYFLIHDFVELPYKDVCISTDICVDGMDVPATTELPANKKIGRWVTKMLYWKFFKKYDIAQHIMCLLQTLCLLWTDHRVFVTIKMLMTVTIGDPY